MLLFSVSNTLVLEKQFYYPKIKVHSQIEGKFWKVYL